MKLVFLSRLIPTSVNRYRGGEIKNVTFGKSHFEEEMSRDGTIIHKNHNTKLR